MSARAKAAGTVYLLHLDRPYRHAAHYIGWTPRDVADRLREHRAGTGARFLAIAAAAGIGFQLARTWPGGRTEERRIKRMRMARRLCPTCRATAAPPGPGPAAARWQQVTAADGRLVWRAAP